MLLQKNSIKIHLLKHNQLNLFQDFIKKYWNQDHIFTENTQLFEWQHKGASAYHYMVATSEKELIGIHGVIPLNQYDKSLPKGEIFLALWRVLEGKGIAIGLRIFDQIIKEYKPTFIAGLPVNINVTKFYKAKKFKILKLNHFVFFSPFISHFNLIKFKNIPKIQKSAFDTKIKIKRLTVNDLLNEHTEELFLNQVPLKSDFYIINRYMKHPIYDYYVYSIKVHTKLKLICVVRINFHGNDYIINIVDYFGPSKNFYLIKYLSSILLKNNNAECVNIYSYGIEEKYLRQAGFKDINEYKGLIVPGLFEPYENKSLDIFCAVYNSNSSCKVRIFKGDGDADRPSKVKKTNICLKI